MIDADSIATVEQAITILDTLYEAGEPCELPKDILKDVREITYFAKVVNPISDPQYDLFRSWLKTNAPDSSIFDQVTASTQNRNVPKVKHNPPMTSISKANGPKRVEVTKKWLQECCSQLNYKATANSDGTPYFVQSLKHDGVACAIYYEKGVLTKAALRPRDGVAGDDITDNVKLVKGVPHKLKMPITCSLRGELECHISLFEKLNAEMKAKGKKEYANPRNYTAGTMQLDTPDPKRHGSIKFTCYAIEGYDAATYKTAQERAKWVNQVLGSPDVPGGPQLLEFVQVRPFDFKSILAIDETSESFEAFLEKLDYEVDGIVLEVNLLDDAESLGREGDNDTGNPRWKLAWKFNEQDATPAVTDLVWETGRTGVITPVATFPAVRLAGTNVTNVTAHNVTRVMNMGIGPGAILRIIKSGKIIPYIVEVIKPAPKHLVTYPKHCPACNAATAIEGQFLVCTNINCVAAASGKFCHYLATFGAKGVAENVVNKMLAAGLLKTYADFYKATPDQLQKAGCTVREAILAYANIHMVPSPEQEKDNGKLLTEAKKAAAKKKKIPLGQLLACFGMPGAGKGTGKDLADTFGTIDKLLAADYAAIRAVANVGDITAQSVHQYLVSQRKEIDDLLECVDPEKPKTGIFSGLSFVFTGSPPQGKEYWMKLVEGEGGKASTSSPSKKTNYVVVGQDAGQKLEKAKQLLKEGHPLKIIDATDLSKMLGLDKKDDRAF